MTRAMRRCTAALLLWVPVAAVAQGDRPAEAARADSVRADSILEARTSALSRQLRCAVCQGISIQESPSGLALEMRAVVKDQLREGRSEAEVKDYFVAKYGEWILLEPKARGFNLLLLYVLPVLLVLGGLAGVAVLVRRWSSPPEAPPA